MRHSASRSAGVSLRGRITAAALLTALAVLCASCAMFLFEQRQAERAQLHKEGKHLSWVLAGPASAAILHGDKAAAQAALAPLRQIGATRSAYLLDGHGRLVGAVGPGTLSPAQIEREHLLEAREPVLVDGDAVGQLVILSRADQVSTALPRYLAMAAGLFFASAGMALLLGRWLAGRISEPVQRLSAIMGEVTESANFAVRMPRPKDEEIGRLTDSFNKLIEQLQLNDQALRKTMAELIAAKEAAEAANLQKSQFLANMSHEIRTPLNGVLAMAQIMARGELSTEQQDRLGVIRRSGETLLSLLNDVLDVSKIEAGKLELEEDNFNPEQVVEEVHATFQPVAEKKGVGLSVSFAPDAAGVWVGDSTRFRQIVSNLASNAIKFTEHGEVRIMVTPSESGEGIHLAVSDTGIGMAPEKLPLLFKKFSQLDASTTRKFGGTGLGLAICHQLTELMGGRIWAESTEGVGSSFHCDLPLARGSASAVAAEPEAAAAEPAADARALRVLAAEDNPTNQIVLRTIMQIFGVELVIVDNGQMALEAWREREFDVILMDIQMPVMDGITAARAIRAAEGETARRRTPILAVSANAMNHQVQEYLAVGMDGHVSKPIELPKLQAALEAATAETPIADEAAA
jgi:signal transduction histidine kinase/CheY-like chemotaxis protein